MRLKLRNYYAVFVVYFITPYLVWPIRDLFEKYDRREKRYLHFTYGVDSTAESLYPVAGPWSTRTARRYGRKWFGRDTVVHEDGTWTEGQWYFSGSSAAYWQDPEDSSYTILAENGREKPPIY